MIEHLKIAFLSIAFAVFFLFAGWLAYGCYVVMHL